MKRSLSVIRMSIRVAAPLALAMSLAAQTPPTTSYPSYPKHVRP